MTKAILASSVTVLCCLIACSDGDPPGPPPSEAGSWCSQTTCTGCCQGNMCMPGNTKAACGGGGQPCVPCTADDVCHDGNCIPNTTGCSNATCPAGCCELGQCRPGTSQAACGKDGSPCTTCTSGQQCAGQECRCDSTSCTGCCGPGGVCRSGTATDACGKGGVPCTQCQSGQSCTAGNCSSSGQCSGANCQGCCAGTQCSPGTADTACGSGGAPCQTCSGGDSCVQGACTNTSMCNPTSCAGCCSGSQCLSGISDTSCGSGGAPCQSCTANLTCQGGSCQASTGSQWDVLVYSATINSAKKWDTLINTAPDPYVGVVGQGNKNGLTSHKPNTYTPVWDEYVFTTTLGDLTGGLGIAVMDDDSPFSGQLIGKCVVPLTEAEVLSGQLKIADCGGLDVQEVVVKFVSK